MMKTSMIPKQIFKDYATALVEETKAPGELDFDTDLMSRNRTGAGTSGLTYEQQKVSVMSGSYEQKLAALRHGINRAFRRG